MKTAILSIALVAAPLFANAAILESKQVKIESTVNVVRLSAQAICKGPRFEDDSYRIYFDAQSFTEIEKYAGYSRTVPGRTCGNPGAATEVSSTDYETVEVVLYNYKEAKDSFDTQIRELVK